MHFQFVIKMVVSKRLCSMNIFNYNQQCFDLKRGSVMYNIYTYISNIFYIPFPTIYYLMRYASCVSKYYYLQFIFQLIPYSLFIIIVCYCSLEIIFFLYGTTILCVLLYVNVIARWMSDKIIRITDCNTSSCIKLSMAVSIYKTYILA